MFREQETICSAARDRGEASLCHVSLDRFTQPQSRAPSALILRLGRGSPASPSSSLDDPLVSLFLEQGILGGFGKACGMFWCDAWLVRFAEERSLHRNSSSDFGPMRSRYCLEKTAGTGNLSHQGAAVDWARNRSVLVLGWAEAPSLSNPPLFTRSSCGPHRHGACKRREATDPHRSCSTDR